MKKTQTFQHAKLDGTGPRVIQQSPFAKMSYIELEEELEILRAGERRGDQNEWNEEKDRMENPGRSRCCGHD